MRKRQGGQAFILVLILLAIGALLVVPALRLTGTSLKSSQIVTRQTKALYAADAAQEYVMWKLLYDVDWRTNNFSDDGDTGYLSLDCCGVLVNMIVVMRAVEGKGGVTLAAEHTIQPTKTVSPDAHLWDNTTYTYTIRLEQLSDNTSQGLDAIYDIPPGDFGSGAYQQGSSQLRVDGGPWLDVPDPEWNAAKGYLKWPADYEWDPVVTGAFSSNPEFLGIEDFNVRQVKELRFQMYGKLKNNDTHCNWVVLKVGDTNTLSGPQAPITVGNGSGECTGEGGLEVTKSSYPEVILPGVPTLVTYTISVTNMATSTHSIQQVIDYLPPDFHYITGSVDNTSTLTTLEPEEPVLEDVNGVEREMVRWTKDQFPGGIDVSIAGNSEETLTLTFQVMAIKDVSGSYYNEIIVLLKETGLPGSAFDEVGVSPGEYGTGYSWTTGTVIVPAYDSEAEAEGVIIDANLGLSVGSITITSYQVQ